MPSGAFTRPAPPLHCVLSHAMLCPCRSHQIAAVPSRLVAFAAFPMLNRAFPMRSSALPFLVGAFTFVAPPFRFGASPSRQFVTLLIHCGSSPHKAIRNHRSSSLCLSFSLQLLSVLILSFAPMSSAVPMRSSALCRPAVAIQAIVLQPLAAPCPCSLRFVSLAL